MTEGKTLVEGGRRAKPKQLPAGPRKKRPLGRLFSSYKIMLGTEETAPVPGLLIVMRPGSPSGERG